MERFAGAVLGAGAILTGVAGALFWLLLLSGYLMGAIPGIIAGGEVLGD